MIATAHVRMLMACRLLIVAATLWGAASLPAIAQACSADSQCTNAGQPRTVCAGNMLVTSRSVCSGSCQTVELSRTPCAGTGSADRCIGAPAIKTPPEAQCAKACVCRGGLLTFATGKADANGTCARETIRCRKGCTCDGEPRCL